MMNLEENGKKWPWSERTRPALRGERETPPTKFRLIVLRAYIWEQIYMLQEPR
jgi:hypothetical protein